MLNGETPLQENDVILMIIDEPNSDGTNCVQGSQIGMRLELPDPDAGWWKGLSMQPEDYQAGPPRLLAEVIPGYSPLTAVTPNRYLNTEHLVLWKAERGGILPPNREETYPAYLITDARENLDGGNIYRFIWVSEG